MIIEALEQRLPLIATAGWTSQTVKQKQNLSSLLLGYALEDTYGPALPDLGDLSRLLPQLVHVAKDKR